MLSSLKKLFCDDTHTYPRVFRGMSTEPMWDSDRLVLEKYVDILSQSTDLTKEELIKLLDEYNDSLDDIVFQVKKRPIVDLLMTLRWYSMIDWVQTPNQLLFFSLPKKKRREIFDLCDNDFSPLS